MSQTTLNEKTETAMNHSTEEAIRRAAEHLALAQHCGIKDDASWADAHAELLNTEDDQTVFETFEPMEHLDHLTADQLYARIDVEADAIEHEMHLVFEMGFNEGANK